MPIQKIIQIKLEVFENEAELSEQEQNLFKIAKQASEKSYSPYSKFCVGAAILLQNGTIVEGTNQENASYPSGLCAERVAFFSCGVLYPKETIEMIAVVARKANSKEFTVVAPCGACSQVMMEFEDKQQKAIALLMQAAKGEIHKIHSIADLLPFRFGAKHLK